MSVVAGVHEAETRQEVHTRRCHIQSAAEVPTARRKYGNAYEALRGKTFPSASSRRLQPGQWTTDSRRSQFFRREP